MDYPTFVEQLDHSEKARDFASFNAFIMGNRLRSSANEMPRRELTVDKRPALQRLTIVRRYDHVGLLIQRRLLEASTT